MRHILVGLLTLFLGACASTSTQIVTTESAEAFPASFQILSVSHRLSELEPCGCSMAPMGGLQRERNLLDKTDLAAGAKRFFFNSGTTFVPPTNTFAAKQLSLYQLKASYLARALDKLQATAVSPAHSDLVLGAEELRKIEKASQFRFVSTNLWDRNAKAAVFSPRLDYKFNGGTVYVFGLSGPGDSAYGVDERFEVRPPEAALEEALAQLPKGEKRMVVVLSALGSEDRQKILNRFPEITLLLGGARGESTWNANLKNFSTLHGIATDLGRSVLQIDVEARGDLRRFTSSFLEEEGKLRLAELEKRLAKAKVTLSRQPAKAQREDLEKKAGEWTRERERIANMPRLSDAGVSYYHSKSVSLGTSFDEPKNEMTALVDEYKEKVKGLALRESED